MSLSYFFTCFLLCLSFPLVWLFFPSCVSCCWHSLLFLVSFYRASSYQFSSLSFLYKRIWTFMGQIMLTRSKGSWAQFVFVYQSHSAEELYSTKELYSAADLYSVIDCFPLHFFLWTFLALRSSWWVLLFIGLSSSWYGFKNGHQHSYCRLFFLLQNRLNIIFGPLFRIL